MATPIRLAGYFHVLALTAVASIDLFMVALAHLHVGNLRPGSALAGVGLFLLILSLCQSWQVLSLEIILTRRAARWFFPAACVLLAGSGLVTANVIRGLLPSGHLMGLLVLACHAVLLMPLLNWWADWRYLPKTDHDLRFRFWGPVRTNRSRREGHRADFFRKKSKRIGLLTEFPLTSPAQVGRVFPHHGPARPAAPPKRVFHYLEEKPDMLVETQVVVTLRKMRTAAKWRQAPAGDAGRSGLSPVEGREKT